ncbi:MAG: serine hydrolase, partial [Polyangiales bacterium]
MSYGRSLRALFALTALGYSGCAEEPADSRYVDAGASLSDGSVQADAGKADAGTRTDGNPATATRDFAKFEKAVDDAVAAHNATATPDLQIRGLSTVVVDREDGVVHTSGHGDFDADRLYLIASSSKILSVGVLMRLADQGKLDIDAPISRYLPEAWGAHKQGVSVASLVSNSSGLPSLGEIIANSSAYLPHLCQYSDQGSLESCGRAIYSDDSPGANREPDKQFRYGGSQWQLAGAVAEQVSGKSWAELIEETYRAPCGVESLGYTNQFAKSSLGYPKDFDGDASLQPKTQNPSIEGGAYITGPDYGKLLHMHLRGGT